ncbi:hypothetical protein NKDENANG_01257 [Candidatus Entotheonellaceae bacterium PAL068K]
MGWDPGVHNRIADAGELVEPLLGRVPGHEIDNITRSAVHAHGGSGCVTPLCGVLLPQGNDPSHRLPTKSLQT